MKRIIRADDQQLNNDILIDIEVSLVQSVDSAKSPEAALTSLKYLTERAKLSTEKRYTANQLLSYDNFIGRVLDVLADYDCSIIDQEQSSDSYSFYITAVAHNKRKIRISIRISDHSRSFSGSSQSVIDIRRYRNSSSSEDDNLIDDLKDELTYIDNNKISIRKVTIKR